MIGKKVTSFNPLDRVSRTTQTESLSTTQVFNQLAKSIVKVITQDGGKSTGFCFGTWESEKPLILLCDHSAKLHVPAITRKQFEDAFKRQYTIDFKKENEDNEPLESELKFDTGVIWDLLVQLDYLSPRDDLPEEYNDYYEVFEPPDVDPIIERLKDQNLSKYHATIEWILEYGFIETYLPISVELENGTVCMASMIQPIPQYDSVVYEVQTSLSVPTLQRADLLPERGETVYFGGFPLSLESVAMDTGII